MRIRSILSILVIFLTLQLNARPIKLEIRTFTQPDGSTFQVRRYGDEFLKVITTTQGHAIVRNSEGWWCYAIYNNDGSKESSGFKVGCDTPSDVLSRSKDIPHEALAANAQRKRVPFAQEGEGILRRTLKAQGVRQQSNTATTKHGLVILAQYSDVKFKYKKQDFVNMLTSKGYSINGATGSAKEYFDSQFEGMFEFDFHVSEIVTLSHERSYYGKNDRYGDDVKPAEMVAEACRLAFEEGTEFSLFDDDSNGEVDNVFIIFAGEDEADEGSSEDCIWSHSWFIYEGAGIKLELDGKSIDQYACTSELMPGGAITGIGTFCHEFAHTLGLPDLYDTDYDESGGETAGLWLSTSLMDGGNMNNNFNTPPYFNAIEREILGLSEPIVLEHNGSYTLPPIHKGGQYYKVKCDNKPQEYYLLECRANDGWDKYIGGTGMLAYHVDKTKPGIWNNNTVNANPYHQYADLIEADGRSDRITESNAHMLGNISGIFFPYKTTATSLTPESKPGFTFWYGGKTNTSITEIKRSGDNITFVVSGLKGDTPPAVTNVKVETFMDAAILSFESKRPYNSEAKIVWGLEGKENEVISIQPYDTGKYAVIIEGLTPQKTYSAIISFVAGGIAGPETKHSFMTSRAAPVEWAYIYIGKNANDDGTYNAGTKIPLRVYNASGAEAIEWELNGEEISPAGDGYFTIQDEGILRAIVYWPERGTDILEKHIILSE